LAACGGGDAGSPTDDGGVDGTNEASDDQSSTDASADTTEAASRDATPDAHDASPDTSDGGDDGSSDAGDAGDSGDDGSDSPPSDAFAADAGDATTQDSGDAGDAGDSGDAGDAGDSGILSWHPLVTQPTFSTDTALLLTDGTVMVHSADDASMWWRLAPDSFGQYGNGTWSQLASLPAGYAPTYFASAVLPDGRVLVEGGEYNGDGGNPVDTTLGALYDPVANTWTPIAPPTGWSTVGDAPGAVLANGVFMMGNATTAEEALFDAGALTWTTTGNGKADLNEEEGWTLLPSGQLLTIDCLNGTQSELYDPEAGAWTGAGSTTVTLVDQQEIGPAVLLPNGDVMATGATPHTAVLHAKTWSAGPDLPGSDAGQLVLGDAPAALLPNGNVLCIASPGLYQTGAHFLEYDGGTFAEVAGTPNAAADSNFFMRVLILPTGEVMVLDGTTDVELREPSGTPDPAWMPTLTTVPSTATRGTTYAIHGTQFNGLSQAMQYGDDAQMATNYPLVRITNNASGHVFYARTHDHSTMAVATGNQDVSTSFDVPMAAETGPSEIVVVANGIASMPAAITIQ
jgi:hypothetical protein